MGIAEVKYHSGGEVPQSEDLFIAVLKKRTSPSGHVHLWETKRDEEEECMHVCVGGGRVRIEGW